MDDPNKCTCCKVRDKGKGRRFLCDQCYKHNGQRSRGTSTGNCIPEDEAGHGAIMTDWGQG